MQSAGIKVVQFQFLPDRVGVRVIQFLPVSRSDQGIVESPSK